MVSSMQPLSTLQQLTKLSHAASTAQRQSCQPWQLQHSRAWWRCMHQAAHQSMLQVPAMVWRQHTEHTWRSATPTMVPRPFHESLCQPLHVHAAGLQHVSSLQQMELLDVPCDDPHAVACLAAAAPSQPGSAVQFCGANEHGAGYPAFKRRCKGIDAFAATREPCLMLTLCGTCSGRHDCRCRCDLLHGWCLPVALCSCALNRLLHYCTATPVGRSSVAYVPCQLCQASKN